MGTPGKGAEGIQTLVKRQPAKVVQGGQGLASEKKDLRPTWEPCPDRSVCHVVNPLLLSSGGYDCFHGLNTDVQ